MKKSNRKKQWLQKGIGVLTGIGALPLLSSCDAESLPTQERMFLSESMDTIDSQPFAIHIDTPDQSVEEEEFLQEEENLRQAKKELIEQIYFNDEQSIVSQFLEDVSLELLQFLVEHEVQILTEPSLNQYHSVYSEAYGEVTGVYLTNENEIFFKKDSDRELIENLTEHFYHEVGHAIDANLGNLAMSEEFRLIFEEGKEIVFPGDEGLNPYYRENVWEYFAECFSLFFKNPEQLARHEETYKFICSVMEKIV